MKYPADSYRKSVKDGDNVGWNYVSFRDDNIRVDHKWRDGEKVYSLSKDVERFNGYIDAYAVNNLEEHTPLEVISEMPQVYNRIFSKFPEYHLAQGGIRIFSSVLDKATGKKKSNYSGDYHNVSLDALRKLPYNLHNPVMVLKGNRANSIEILTMIKDESGRSVMAVIQLYEEERHNVINRISTVFGKDSAQYFLNKLESGKGLYVNKKRADDWSLSAKVQSLGEVLLKARSFGTIIDENDSAKYSITSSENFRKWFGKSKMVEDDGTPKIFYHGTSWDPMSEPYGNAVFDDSMRGTASGDMGFYGRGHYFAFSRREAGRYGGNVIEAYLRIENPYNVEKELMTLDGSQSDRAPWVPRCVNLAEKFPEIADDIKFTWYSENDESPDGLEPHEISMKDVADEIRRVDEEISFRVSDDGEGGIIISDGQGFEFRATKRAENDRWLKVGRYVENVSFPHLDVPVLRTAMMDPRFTETVKKMGYDGIVQSMDGDEAVVFNSNQIKSATDNNGEFSLENPDIRYSIGTRPDGRKYVKVDIDQDLFDGLSPKDCLHLARKVILDRFRGKVIGDYPDNAYVNRETAKEYAYPASVKRLTNDVMEAKGRASTELDELMKAAVFTDHVEDDGRHSDAIGGWDHYSVEFEFSPDKVFRGQISIKITDKGRVFHDMTQIEKVPASVNGSNDRILNRDHGHNITRKRLSVSHGEDADSGDGQFRSGFYTPTEEYSIPRLLMPYLQENPDAEALEVREHLESQGVRVARDEDAERFLLAARSALREDEARTAEACPSSCPARASTA